MAAQYPQGFECILKATVYSWQGLKAASYNEAAFLSLINVLVVWGLVLFL